MINQQLNELIGKSIQIINMEGEPQYTGRKGVVTSVDAIGQLHGTWGGCALIPDTDEWIILSKLN